MNIHSIPSPLTTSPADDFNFTNGMFFDLEPLLPKTNNLFEAAANGQVDDIQSYLLTTKNKADILDQNGDSALHHAARMNRVQVIDFMLTAGASVDIYSKDGFTPLHLAARCGALEALDALLKKGANPNRASEYSACTALHFAAQFGHRLITDRLLKEKDLDIDATDQQGMTALHMAINRGYGEICEDLVNNDANVTMTTTKGQTCLHLAAASGNMDIVALIIQSALRKHLRNPGDAIKSMKEVPEFQQFINHEDTAKNSALHIAVQAGTAAMCQVLLEYGADVNIQNRCLHTPVHVATVGKSKKILELLIKRGGKTFSKDGKQETPLHSAASFGNLEFVEILLKNLAAVDCKEANGMTPFLCAVAAGQTKCAELLLDSGADITARDKFQRTSIHLAVQQEKHATLKMLLERSESGLANAPDVHEKTPLHYAASSANLLLLEILLETKANCLLKDGDGKTPLHLAAEAGKARHVEALAKASLASVDQKDLGDRTPLHVAALNGRGKICSILLQMGADIDSPDVYSWTPLLFAAKNGSVGLIRMFLELKTNINHEDKNGNTALLIASARGHVEAVKVLLDHKASLKPGDDGLNCLDVAIENQHGDVVLAIIKNSRWRDILSAKSPYGENRMGKLIQLFPDAAKSVMDRCIHRSLAHRSITYDFSLLDPGPDDQSGPGEEPFFGLMDMVNHKQKELLVHDLSRKLLKIKWRSYGWFIFWTNLALFGFFLFLMTYFMLTQRKLIVLKKSHNAGDDVDDVYVKKDAFNKISPFLILIFASLHLVKELYQIAVQRMQYFKQLTNLLEWTLYVTTIVFILPYVSSSLSSLRGDPRVTWQVGTVAVFLGYMNLILFMQTLDHVGIYVTMFFQVAKTVLQAITFFALFALAFSVVFFILFKEQTAFDSIEMSLMQVLKMTLGELDYNTVMVDSLYDKNPKTNAPLLPYRESSTVFMGIFIFVMPIILTNLLVGLAVGDIESVQKYAFLRNKGKFINFVVGIERKFPKCITRRFHKPQLVVTGRKVEKKISSQKYTFEDKDLGDEDHRPENEDEQRLDMLTKELAKAKQRQTSIIDTMHDQMNILLAVAARVGVDTRYDNIDKASRDVSL